MSPPEPQWFAIWTRARHERVVFDELTRKEIGAFLPTVTRWSRWKDRRKQIAWPLFPGYCFAQFAVADRLRVLTCLGVSGIVSFNGAPAPVLEAELDSVRRVLASAMPCDPCPLIHEGARVEIVHGPLRGTLGRLLRKGNRTRVVVAVDVIGQGVSVEVDAADIVER
jgi:transcription antitermination factor NusG